MGSAPRAVPVGRYAPRLAPLSISAACSPVLKLILAAIHLLPLIAAVGTGVPVVISVLVFAGVFGSGVYQFRLQAKLRSLRLHLLPDGEMQMEASGVRHDAALQPGSVDMGWLVVLTLRTDDGRIERCALARDGLGEEAWRALKIWLRWRPASAAE